MLPQLRQLACSSPTHGMDAVGHWACETCDAEFWSEDATEVHMDDYGHRTPRFECEACTSMFQSSQEARQHMDTNNH